MTHTSHMVGTPASLGCRGQESWGRRAVARLVALVVLVGTLAMLGCDGGGGDGNPAPAPALPAPVPPASTLTDATAGDLANRVFVFPNGVGANLSATTGLPQGQVFILRFGSFSGTNTGPVTLESGGNTATGTVTIGSCTFRINQSTFPARQGPQAGTQAVADPCQIDRSNGSLRLVDPQSLESVTSSPSSASSTPNVAFVITTDFETGSYSVVDLATRNVTRDIRRGGVHSDATPARFLGGRIYVVNRFGADSIQIIDPQQGFLTPTNGELSVGNGTNPQDIAFANANKAYVSRLASPRLLIINPTTLTRLGELDLSSLVQPNDRDGSPDPTRMLVNNGLLYVALQHIDFTTSFPSTKVAPGEVVVIDPATDRIVRVIQLNGTNPFSELQFSPTLNRILVSSVGNFGVFDGGIEDIDPVTNTVVPGFVITEAAMGGDITAFGIVSSTKGFAIVLGANFVNSLVTFNPSTGQRLQTVLVAPANAFFPHLAINSRNELYVSVSDQRTPGLRVFNTVSDSELTTTTLNVGLPPVFTLFIE